MTLHQTLDLAFQHHRAKRLAEAEKLYRQILAEHPNNPDALHLLGMLAFDSGQFSAAAELVRRAIAAFPNSPDYHHNLGLILLAEGNSAAEAQQAFARAVQLKPDFASAHFHLAKTLRAAGKHVESIDAYRRALQLKPESPEMLNAIGDALLQARLVSEATVAFESAIRFNPNFADAHNNLGKCHRALGKLEAAEQAYRAALKLDPNLAEVHNNLANILRQQGQLDRAFVEFNEAIRFKPEVAEIHNNFGTALSDAGRIDDAIAAFRRAMQLSPTDPIPHSNLVYTLHFHPNYDAEAIFKEHRSWNALHAEPPKREILPHDNERSPDRPLRIGYVSPDFGRHVVGGFLLPLWENHDRKKFHIFAYSGVQSPDAMTERLRACTDQWRNILGWADSAVADLIRRDRIDILLDLSLHSSGNRLLVFARKPAPVQVSYLGYCSTTGLDAIDYRLTDPYLDPPEAGDEFYSEKSIRLPRTYWCYRRALETPPVGRLPATAAGFVTFGCLNNFAKVSSITVRAWAKVLREAPTARLIIQSARGSHRQRVLDDFGQAGVDPQRVRFVGYVPAAEYFQEYHQIDIALDPFPFNGGTTTCDALWMGVPVVSLVGNRSVSRAGLSILSNVGLPELVARDEDEYVKIAVELANDLPRLSGLRSSLRQRMLASPLTDAAQFARDIEAAYRRMWQNWCTS